MPSLATSIAAMCRTVYREPSQLPEVPTSPSRVQANGGGRGGKREQGSRSTLHGRSDAYVVARLKRDDPDLAELVVAGKVTPPAGCASDDCRLATYMAVVLGLEWPSSRCTANKSRVPPYAWVANRWRYPYRRQSLGRVVRAVSRLVCPVEERLQRPPDAAPGGRRALILELRSLLR